MKNILAILAVTLAPISAFAACSTPTADAGSMFYNTGQNALQFCNGDDWYNTGLVVPTASGTTCSTPTGPEGSAFYNTTQNTMQFCNGDDWVNMGTMRFPSATGTSCTTPTGPEGGMFFNTTTKTMQFCNGDDWVNATYLTIAAAAVVDGTEIAKVQALDIEANDYFGGSVAIHGDYAIFGAQGEDTGSSNAGAAYIFKRTGANWAQEAKLMASDAQVDDYFGQSVSINGDYAIVGAWQEDTGLSNVGAAYIFKRSGTSWVQESKIQASDPDTNDYFGISVSINGNYAAVGAYQEDTGGNAAGAVYVFKRSGTTWTQEAKIQSSDIEASDYFGRSITLDGNYLAVGVGEEDTGGSQTGSVYVFKRSGTTWPQEAKIQATDSSSGARFGNSISMSGDYIIAGATNPNTGTLNSGGAYVFKRFGTTWTQQAKIQASDIKVQATLGISVAINDGFAVVGSYDDNIEGAIYIFEQSGTTWTEIRKIKSANVETNARFGSIVAMDDGIVVVGSIYEDVGGPDAGAAYFFD